MEISDLGCGRCRTSQTTSASRCGRFTTGAATTTAPVLARFGRYLRYEPAEVRLVRVVARRPRGIGGSLWADHRCRSAHMAGFEVYPLTWGGSALGCGTGDIMASTRHIERVGPSRTGAENNLKQALRDRARVSADGEITAQTKVSRLAELWLRDIDESDRAIRTKITYRDVWIGASPHRSANCGSGTSVCLVWPG